MIHYIVSLRVKSGILIRDSLRFPCPESGSNGLSTLSPIFSKFGKLQAFFAFLCSFHGLPLSVYHFPLLSTKYPFYLLFQDTFPLSVCAWGQKVCIRISHPDVGYKLVVVGSQKMIILLVPLGNPCSMDGQTRIPVLHNTLMRNITITTHYHELWSTLITCRQSLQQLISFICVQTQPGKKKNNKLTSSKQCQKLGPTGIQLSTLRHNARQNMYRVRLKKMTQRVKCDYSVTPENFCAKFSMLVKEGAAH